MISNTHTSHPHHLSLPLLLTLALTFLHPLHQTNAIIPISFDHGISSGDPQPTRIILWTRITIRTSLPPPPEATVSVRWAISLTPDMSHVVTRGTKLATAIRDWTIHADATNLTPATRYYYRFYAGGIASPVGRTKTAPSYRADVSRLRYAIFGCSMYGVAYFNAYDFVSRYDDVDFVLHLGDFLYEYSHAQLNPTMYGRQNFRHIPHTEPLPSTTHITGHVSTASMSGELLTLQDYLARYRSYRADAGLQALAASTPWVAIWDDHETADNAYVNGSRNHNDVRGLEEGSWENRKRDAVRAWHLYMPIRHKRSLDDDEALHDTRIYRRLRFGKLLSLILLENRLLARTDSNPRPGDPIEIFSDEIDSIYGRVRDVIGDVPVSEWGKGGEDSVAARLSALREELDAFREREDGHIIGDEQLDFLARGVREAAEGGTRWMVVGQQQVMGDLYVADFDAAVEKAPDVVQKALWRAVVRNLTGEGMTDGEVATTCSYATYPAGRRNEYGECFKVSEKTRELVRVLQAAGRHRINWAFDDWHGYLTERRKVFDILSQLRGNVIVHASDVHNSFSSVLRTGDGASSLNGARIVGAEFTVATTSEGLEGAMTVMPMALADAAIVAANAPSMRYASTNGKGTAVVTVTKEKAHVDYYYMDEPSKMDYEGVCDKGMDYYHSSVLEGVGVTPDENDIVVGKCLPGPKARPYSWMLRNTGIHFDNEHLVDVSF